MSTFDRVDSRLEQDYVGQVQIPAGKLYGVNSVRGFENLSVSPLTVAHYSAFRDAFAQCKWAAALANLDSGVVAKPQAEAIAQACQEVIAGNCDESLIVDLLEGSGGTSTNMNFNEVIANRAQLFLGQGPGAYDVVHPNDHVNCSRSTNDVYPAALKIATYAMLGGLISEVEKLAVQFDAKAEQFADAGLCARLKLSFIKMSAAGCSRTLFPLCRSFYLMQVNNENAQCWNRGSGALTHFGDHCNGSN